MKRRKSAAIPRRIIKVGGVYRDVVRGVTVTAEDHEVQGGRRTGRILVCAAEGNPRLPRRWYCREADLAEVQQDLLLPIIPSDDGVSP